MEILYKNCLKAHTIYDEFWSLTFWIHVKRIAMFTHCFNVKRPEHGVNHLWPMLHPMKKKSARSEGELHIAILNDLVLVMSTNPTKGNFLTLVIYVLVEACIAKKTIVSMVVLGSVTSLLKDLLMSSLNKKSLLKSYIPHEMNIDETLAWSQKLAVAQMQSLVGKLAICSIKPS